MNFTDERDGETYPVVEIGGRYWLAASLRYAGVEGSCLSPGGARLYTWQGARAACPAGWRLPGAADWAALMTEAGGYFDWKTAAEQGDALAGLQAFLPGGTFADFGLQFDGWANANGEFFDAGLAVSFWTGEEQSEDEAPAAEFHSEAGLLLHPDEAKANAFSLRLLRLA